MKLLERKKVRTPFQDLLAEAVATERELRALDARAATKLRAPAFIAEALSAARTTREKVEALRRSLEADGGRTTPTAARAVRELLAFIRSGNCPRPTAQVGRLRIFDRDGLAAAEVQALGGSGLLDLQAVAALIAAERYPEAFGQNENWDGWVQRRAQLTAQRTLLLQRVEAEYGPGDLSFAEPSEQRLRAEGYMRVAFAISGGEVTIGPGSGERLISWLVTRNVEV